jgi:hypothetical protein
MRDYAEISDVRAWQVGCEAGLWLGFVGLWLNILEAKAKALEEGLAWPGFNFFFNRPCITEAFLA